MIRPIHLALVVGLILLFSSPAGAQESRDELLDRLTEIARIEKGLLVPMRDGVGLSTDIYLPATGEGPFPTVFWRTPYNYSRLGGSRLRTLIRCMESGYAFVIQNERGRYDSEGTWAILGHPRLDGYDALTWIAEQDWSNGRVGTQGCSSSAEWQLALAAMDHPAHAAMVPMASGAGIGRVGRYHEQGNWYRGGAFQMLFAVWLFGVEGASRPRVEAQDGEGPGRRNRRRVDWNQALTHLPLEQMLAVEGGLPGVFEEFIRRTPDDPAWYQGGLYHDNEPFGVPSLWLNSWYDVSIGPNLELFNHAVERGTDAEARSNQYLIVAPTPHCRFQNSEGDVIVGERNMGAAGRDYDSLVFRWFDYWLKGERNGFARDTAKVQYYTMGANRWQSAPTWPPPGARLETWYLDSDGKANSLDGDGRLSRSPPAEDRSSDTFVYDPETPVPSYGGGVCCTGGAVKAGSFDQRKNEQRHDVLVYTSEPLTEDLEVTGFIEVTLYVSSDARDTDFTVKLVDVLPDGTAYNVDETIQRVRYREGYDRQVFMEPGEVYPLEVSPMATSNTFQAGHRIRIEISSSNFPRFARNLNTGGNNFDEEKGVVARNTVHHSRVHRSQIRLPAVRGRDY